MSKKILFIHIPKTGGTSVSKALAECGIKSGPSKHTSILEYKKNNKKIDEYFKFTFVRNPWDLTLSLYNYLWHGTAGWPKRWRTKMSARAKADLGWSFEDWVKSELFSISSPAAIWGKNHRQKQLDWILDKEGDMGVDFVGRFENLQTDFDFVCHNAGIPQHKLPHVNAGPKRDRYMKYYNNETRRIVAKKYAKDIEYFGYEFGN